MNLGEEVPRDPIAARASKAVLESGFLRAALDCIVIADAENRVVEFNPSAEETFGYSRDEALGRPLTELIIPPSLRDAHRRAFDAFVESRSPKLLGRRIEIAAMRADGTEFPVELALSQIGGDPLLICGAIRDLSTEK